MIIVCILERKAALTLAGTNTIENIKERHFPILTLITPNLTLIITFMFIKCININAQIIQNVATRNGTGNV